MIKFIATDLDGTLINDEGKINEKIFDLIKKLNKKGVIFSAASGRFHSQLSMNFHQVEADMVFIAHNGALVKYNNNGQTIYSSCIKKEDIMGVLDIDYKFKADLFLAGDDHAYVVKPSEDLLEAFKFSKVPWVELDSFDEVDEKIYKITYYVPDGIKPDMLEYLENNLDDNLKFVASGNCWLDIMNKGVSKGNSIRILQEMFDISRDHTMAFGDYYNDLTMFEVAHHSYAMENAPEDVKKQAKFIAQSNNDNGVYNVIYKYAASL